MTILSIQQRSKNFKRVVQLSIMASFLFIIVSAIGLFYAEELNLYTVSETFYTVYALVLTFSGFLDLALVILGAVFGIMWFRRCYKNVNEFGQLNDSPDHYFVWSWIVPIYGLYKPYNMTKEIWENTRFVLSRAKDSKILQDAPLGYWWTFWVIGSIADNIAFRLTSFDEYADFIEIGSTIFSLIASVCTIAGGYFLLKMIDVYSPVGEYLVVNQERIKNPETKPERFEDFETVQS